MKANLPLAVAMVCASLIPAAAPAQAQTPGETQSACTPVEVATFADRTHVRCAASNTGGPFAANADGVVYFAVPTGSPMAGILTDMAMTARATNKSLRVTYRTSTAQNPPGCQASDCRLLVSARIEY